MQYEIMILEKDSLSVMKLQLVKYLNLTPMLADFALSDKVSDFQDPRNASVNKLVSSPDRLRPAFGFSPLWH